MHFRRKIRLRIVLSILLLLFLLFAAKPLYIFIVNEQAPGLDVNNVPLPIPPEKKGNTALLLWWSFWPWWAWRMQRLAERCEESHGFTCVLTPDRRMLGQADALVFNDWELARVDMPPRTDTTGWPKWIYHQNESPLHTKDYLKHFDSIFHWTMTYRRDSDFPYPYGGYTPGASNSSLPNRTKLVAWLVTACHRPSRRQDIAEELRHFLPVDIYGPCGPLKLDCQRETGVNCYDQLSLDYKFYLSFENSVCSDYVTEKAWDALRAGMVPIVYGGADYATILPPQSFIDITTFESLKDLADFILHLDSNEEEYQRYFEWRRNYTIEDPKVVWSRSFCTLCGRLLKERGMPRNDSRIPDLQDVWYGFKGPKRRAPKFLQKYLPHINRRKIPACDLFRSKSPGSGSGGVMLLLLVIGFVMLYPRYGP